MVEARAMEKIWDYVVAGGGSSGCVAASELAARGASVLLLEQGDDAETHPETLRADGYREAFINDALMIPRFSAPQPGIRGRRIFLGSGRGLGGSGSINAMVYTRGGRQDYAAWGEGWGWDDVRPDFEAIEARLAVRRREPTAFTEACIAAAGTVGLRRKEDLNDGDLDGVLGYEWMNFEGERRKSSYVAFVKDRSLPTLEVRTNARVLRVAFGEGKRAAGIEYEEGGALHFARAKHEVILAMGALETPRLLMLSGVGDQTELARAGVALTAHAPGVGKNLHDHPNVTLFFLASGDVDCHYPQLYGFDRVRGAEGPPDTCYVFYPARSSFKEGMMRMLPAMVLPPGAHGTAAPFFRSLIGGAMSRDVASRLVRRLYGIVVILGKPTSRGSVALASSDPRAPAVIDPAYLDAPADRKAMLEGIRRARAIAAAGPLRELGNREVLPGAFGRSTAGTARFLENNIMTTYHYAGTCRMGDDRDAVLDRRLRVRGVQGLRVADASAIPEAPVSALNAPSMLLGFRAARHATEDRGA
jgi:choline dehydrogenase-like flavoprotein